MACIKCARFLGRKMDQELRELYQDLILDHGRNPRNFHAAEKPTCEAVGHNPLCGDQLVLYLTIGDDGLIAEATFQGEGCAISMASASMMTEMLTGKTPDAAKKLWAYFESICKGKESEVPSDLDEDDAARLDALSGVKQYPVRVKCATLAWRTMEAALDPASKHEISTEA